MPLTRTESDALGEKAVPAGAYYGINTARAVENFSVSGLRAHPRFIDAFLRIKKAAALTNVSFGLLEEETGRAVAAAADEILSGALRDQFVVDVFQMGAGTALHMNVNEVLANCAIERLGGEKGRYDLVHPNDHVNLGQSTNDVFPTAIRVATRVLLEDLLSTLDRAGAAFSERARAFDGVVKSARTHLQDAVPIRLGQEFAAYGVAVARAAARLRAAATEVEELGIGGTAAGTGLNAHPDFRFRVVESLARETGFPFRPAEDLCEAMQSQRPLAEVSAALRNLALELCRIASDIRLLASGPATGLAELQLPPVQAGSSIMPGKVNPSMAEMLNMVSFQVVGNDAALALAVQAGQLELNVMMPLMAFDLFFSIEILTNGVALFTDRCLRGIEADPARCRAYADTSTALATALNPVMGYARAAALAKEAAATGKTVLQLAKERNILPPAELDALLNPDRLTR